ncbi:hypothetical protein B0H11DRAFT_2061279 [Mycena galericulata]|nr:hypothetical protein B0H11DRAFT_2110508 [Mycena galericulata]KAJ7458658.1 hypothetical protein B0H11DRAFT_2061279 [Mycena galericulata]
MDAVPMDRPESPELSALNNLFDQKLFYFPSLEQLLLTDAPHEPGSHREAREDDLTATMEVKNSVTPNGLPLLWNSSIHRVSSLQCLHPEAFVPAAPALPPDMISSQMLSPDLTTDFQPIARTVSKTLITLIGTKRGDPDGKQTPPLRRDVFSPWSNLVPFDVGNESFGVGGDSVDSSVCEFTLAAHATLCQRKDVHLLLNDSNTDELTSTVLHISRPPMSPSQPHRCNIRDLKATGLRKKLELHRRKGSVFWRPL